MSKLNSYMSRGNKVVNYGESFTAYLDYLLSVSCTCSREEKAEMNNK